MIILSIRSDTISFVRDFSTSTSIRVIETLTCGALVESEMGTITEVNVNGWTTQFVSGQVFGVGTSLTLINSTVIANTVINWEVGSGNGTQTSIENMG
jgi:hypothetical protein